jgi:mRNA interferase RelE/StbE
MASYKIEILPSGARDLRRLTRRTLIRAQAAIDSLAENPRRRGVKKIEGESATYRLRIGDYRVIYTIDDAGRVVLVQYVRHRREAYRRR